MHLIFCFLGFLSLGLFIRSKNYTEEQSQVPMVWFTQIKWVKTWFFFIGTLLPIIIIFSYEVWYFAVLYSIMGIFVANVISEYYTFQKLNRINIVQPFILSILASMIFIFMQII